VATNLQLDDRLIAEAAALGKHRTKKDAVTQALTDYIRHLRQERILVIAPLRNVMYLVATGRRLNELLQSP